MATLAELMTKWEARRTEGARLTATAPIALLAADVLSDLRALQLDARDVMSVREAALVGGYSADHLRREIAHGRIPNVGTKGKPALRRADVPLKPGHPAPLPSTVHGTSIDARRRIVLEATTTPLRSA